MPKDRRVPSFPFHRHRASPYNSVSEKPKQNKSEYPLGSVEDLKEWDEARCSICIEHPHNAVMLKCSSWEKGCRPYICDTSYRHSNCLDQFCKSFASTPSTAPPQVHLSRAASRWREEPSQSGQTRPLENQPKLVCPLCRGEVYGWGAVIEPARQYMNSKSRSCACETCDFSGTYSELRKHARSEHPYVRPSEVDPTREHDWRRLERERELDDILSTVGSVFGENSDESFFDFYSWMAFSFLRALFGASRSSSPIIREQQRTSSSGRTRRGIYDMDNSGRTRRGRYIMENCPPSRSSNRQSDSWERMPGSRREWWQNRRQ